MSKDMENVDSALIWEELVDDNTPDCSSLEIASTVNIEPADVGALDPASKIQSGLEASTDVKQEMDIGPIVLQRPDIPFSPQCFKSEPVEDSSEQSLKKEHVDDTCHDGSLSDVMIIVKLEPTDVGEDVGSLYPAGTVQCELEASTDVKQEVDIVPIVLQTPDVHYTWRECKSEPVEDSSEQNTVATVPRSNSTTEESASTSTSPHVETHSVHHDSGPFRCGICDKAFRMINKLQNHVLTVHTQKKQYPCYICFKHFTRKCELERHMLVHTGERPHCCGVCDKSFARKDCLRIHMKSHSGERPYCCTVCHKSFVQNGNLQTHMMTHLSERPHCCSMCNKSFTSKSFLKIHLMSHTGERPHWCGVCNKSFALKHDLKLHLMIHTGERPYPCDVCEKAFSCKGYLMRHKLTHK